MSKAGKNLLSNTEVLLQKILDKLDDIYVCQEAMLEIQDAAYKLATGEDLLAQAMTKVKF